MQFSIKKFSLSLVAAVLLTATLAVQAGSANKHTYTEDQFLSAFSGKSQKIITEQLGAPAKKEQSIKPAGAASFMAKAGADDQNSKPVKVEMWYYHNLVKYDKKHTYKETELTFVNDRVMNIAFFNNR
ncbi:hypothetical protein GALL_193800 [mine drainage metagenome]|uniref:Uncharacterized protein n=1 Tax=mine drainage metagenome TaxID=410659 RepID=A0A1J5S9Y8_9ZZZZ